MREFSGRIEERGSGEGKRGRGGGGGRSEVEGREEPAWRSWRQSV